MSVIKAMRAAVAAALCAASVAPAVAAVEGAVPLFAVDAEPSAVIEQVVTAVALEPDAAFAALLVTAAAQELGAEDVARLGELLDGVLLVLPEDMARDLAPRLVAQVAGADEFVREQLSAAVAPAVGVEPGELAAGAERIVTTAAARAAPSERQRIAGDDDDEAMAAEGMAWMPLSQAQVVDVTGSDDVLSVDVATTGLLAFLQGILPMVTEADILAFADAWGLSHQDLLALVEHVRRTGTLPTQYVVVEIPPPPDPGPTASPW